MGQPCTCRGILFKRIRGELIRTQHAGECGDPTVWIAHAVERPGGGVTPVRDGARGVPALHALGQSDDPLEVRRCSRLDAEYVASAWEEGFPYRRRLYQIEHVGRVAPQICRDGSATFG